MIEFTRRKLGPSQWALVDCSGIERGRYGGRAGHRWADVVDLDEDGSPVTVKVVTEDSPISADTCRRVLELAIREYLDGRVNRAHVRITIDAYLDVQAGSYVATEVLDRLKLVEGLEAADVDVKVLTVLERAPAGVGRLRHG